MFKNIKILSTLISYIICNLPVVCFTYYLYHNNFLNDKQNLRTFNKYTFKFIQLTNSYKFTHILTQSDKVKVRATSKILILYHI